MSDEDNVSLKEFMEVSMESVKELIQSRISSIERELSLARQSLDKRLEGMNEFRDQMRDQAKMFLPREEYIPRHEALEKRISGLEKITWGIAGGLFLLEILLRVLPLHL